MRKSSLSVVLAGLALALAAPAAAGSLYKDRVHADSFGNLVVYSASGYKRILVGQGEVADSYNLTGSYYEPETAQIREPVRHLKRCSQPPYRWQGRSHMYGLPDHVVPEPPIVCR